LRERLGNGSADATAAAGNQSRFMLECHGRVDPELSVSVARAQSPTFDY
jgi:hypothetical protein